MHQNIPNNNVLNKAGCLSLSGRSPEGAEEGGHGRPWSAGTQAPSGSLAPILRGPYGPTGLREPQPALQAVGRGEEDGQKTQIQPGSPVQGRVDAPKDGLLSLTHENKGRTVGCG